MKTLPDSNTGIRLSKPLRALVNQFLSKPGRAFSLHNLAVATWDWRWRERNLNAVRVNVCRLRRKLAGTQYRIETVRGGGYRVVLAEISLS